jgi:hypothetical protein
MKKSRLIILLLLVASFVASCSKTSSKIEVTHIPVKLKEDGNWSLLNLKTGKLIFEGEFKNKPSVVTDGIFISENDKGKYFYNKIEEDKKYKQFAGPFVKAQNFTEGVAIVCKEDDYVSAINTKGEEIFKLKPENGIEFDVVGQCFEGMIIFRTKTGYLGFLDKEGKIAIKPEYDYAEDFKGGYARVSKNIKSKDKVQLIDKEGNVKTDLDYAMIGSVDGGLMPYSNTKEEFGVIDVNKDKEKVITASSKYEEIIIVHGDIFYSADDEWGMLDAKGEVVIRAKYKRLSRLSNERFLGIKKDGDEVKYDLLDAKGEIIKSQDIEEVYSAENGNIIIQDGKYYELKNQDGEAVGKETFKVMDGYEDLLRICNGESDATYSQYFDWSIIEKSLKQITQKSVLGIVPNENCLATEKHLANLSINDNANGKEEKYAEGMAKSGRTIRMGLYKMYCIGSGYSDEDNASNEESDDNSSIESPVDTTLAAVPSGSVNDKAPDWSNYQRSLEKSVSIGRYSSINIEVWFDNVIKNAITNTVYKTDAYWGYTYPVTETVGYEKNANAKAYYISVKYDVESSKVEKMKKLLQAFFKDGGFKFVSDYNEKKNYTDAAGNSWTLDGTSIIFEKAYDFSSIYDTTAAAAAH